MTVAVLVAMGLGVALAAAAAKIAVERRRAPALPPPDRDAAPVTVLLPVRNEEDNVLPCLETLLASDERPRVLVINDGSTDRTAGLVAERVASDPRLVLIAAGELPDGWHGKVHALWVGAQQATTPWLLLTDADTRHDPALLSRALAATRGLDAVSLAGTQEVEGWGENLLVPGVFAVLDALLGDWTAAAQGAGPPVANGQFILLRRAAWEQCGGFEAIRGAASDDVAIARGLAAEGFKVGFFRAPRLLRIRMYRGTRATLRGWRRNLGGLLGPDLGRAGLILGALLAVPIAGAVLLATGEPLAAAALWLAGAASSALLRFGSGHRPAYGLLFPIDAVWLAGLMILSVRDYRAGELVAWKGRAMRVREPDGRTP